MALNDDADDATYLTALRQSLPQVWDMARADLAIYLAGADPYFDDQFGHMKLTKPGLANRDCFVLDSCRAINLPVAITMAGGYSKHVEDTVDIHFRTVEIAVELNRKH